MTDAGRMSAFAPDYRAAFLAYERAKRDWIAANPGATPAEYGAAMRGLAERYRI